MDDGLVLAERPRRRRHRPEQPDELPDHHQRRDGRRRRSRSTASSTRSRTTTTTCSSSPTAACDPSGHGEGELFLGSLGISSGPTGIVNFHRVFTQPPLGGRTIITMAASDPESSSEFSPCETIAVRPQPHAHSVDDSNSDADAQPTPTPSPSQRSAGAESRLQLQRFDRRHRRLSWPRLPCDRRRRRPDGCPDFGDHDRRTACSVTPIATAQITARDLPRRADPRRGREPAAAAVRLFAGSLLARATIDRVVLSTLTKDDGPRPRR